MMRRLIAKFSMRSAPDNAPPEWPSGFAYPMQRPISVEEHVAAVDRLAAERPFIMVDVGDGRGAQKWYTGTVDARDYTRRDGYPVRVSAFGVDVDQFGWPVGDERSPARLYDGTSAAQKSDGASLTESDGR